MSDNESDKTKIRIPASKKPVSDDATRIAPAKKSDNNLSDDDKTRIAPTTKTTNQTVDDDKTRVAQPRKPAQAADDKTRIAPAKKHSATPDVTQFKPVVTPLEDKTRISPASNSNDNTDPTLSTGQFLASEVKVGEHGILKDRFVLESVLGAGGMGIVYKAKDLLKVEAQDRDPYVAIKVLSEEFKAHPEAFISLQRESRKSQRIAHPNIVNVFDFDRDGDTVFMTMEFMDGQPLDQLIRQYKSTGLPTDDAWAIIKGMSLALSHAHAEKIIHSDFKPGNVFVTQRGLAKVFDFGIARAVSKVEHLDDNPEDKTVFDAGNLGALTPAYASLEMLQGEEPDIRDDIYALGCVAYELFTGSHPYNKVPADEAERQKLKPKRINNIKKYQWRAIEKAISFKREDRMESVDKFIEAISPKLKAPNRMATIFALLLSVVITGYFLFIQDQPVDPYSEFDIRNELELKIRIDFYKEDLVNLLKNPTFTDPWEDSTWKDIKDLLILTKGEDPWVIDQKEVAYKLYLAEITTAIKAYKYRKAKLLIENAKRYTDDHDALNLKTKEIAASIEQNKNRIAKQAEREQANMLAQQTRKKVTTKKISAKQKETQLFDVALSNVNNQLKCQGRLNMRNLETAIDKLRELDLKRYNNIKNNLINSLAACIKQTGKAFPERAREAKAHSLRIFKSNRVLAAIEIDSRDPCDKSLAGLGARGKRAICKDKIKDSGTGPVLVVIPGNSRFKTFAIGKYEVSIKELNAFCKKSSSCKPLTGSDTQLPASKLSFKVVKAYIKWLSKQSGQKYRLPTKNEWVYAAKSRRKNLDANRNCKLSTRGIQKGGKLVSTNIGKQNSWGLVNYVGNVQEWVYDKGRKLVAVGGSFEQSMEDCDVTTTLAHNGSADIATGFRVLRELR
ncbi:MAG: bifunctional serine/threonine-protein kinase/formylglycine-generating enzyme family protein [Gammaproteobacteria bacterium]|nr:bifunctional serine/threonine-protein kinase/formylglycine-generating enzyme family protein [Gammaproteobacteria bacterium]